MSLHTCESTKKKTDDGIKVVEVAWAQGSGSSMLFEAFMLELYNHMSVSEMSNRYHITENRIWRVLDFCITQEIEKQDFSKEPIETLSVDEIARGKHLYVAKFFKRWYKRVMKSNIPEMIKAANTILDHIDGILLHIKTNITKRAFEFKGSKNLKITIFIALDKLNLTPA